MTMQERLTDIAAQFDALCSAGAIHRFAEAGAASLSHAIDAALIAAAAANDERAEPAAAERSVHERLERIEAVLAVAGLQVP